MVEYTPYLVRALLYIRGRLPLRSIKGFANILDPLTQQSLTIQSTVKLERNVRISLSNFWKMFNLGGSTRSRKENICGTLGLEELSTSRKLYFRNDKLDFIVVC